MEEEAGCDSSDSKIQVFQQLERDMEGNTSCYGISVVVLSLRTLSHRGNNTLPNPLSRLGAHAYKDRVMPLGYPSGFLPRLLGLHHIAFDPNKFHDPTRIKRIYTRWMS